MAFEILTPDEMAKADRLDDRVRPRRRHRPDAARRARRSLRSSSSAFPMRLASPCWPVPATMAATAMSSPRNCGGPASTSRCGASRRREPGTDAAIAAAECSVAGAAARRFRAEHRAGWSSTRCSAPAWRGRSTASTPRRSARLDGGRRARRRRRPAERRVGPERRGAGKRAARRGSPSPSSARSPGICFIPAGRYCGEMVVADIGIRDDVLSAIGSSLRRERSERTGCACSRRRPPTRTNMRAAMSACFPAGRRRPARRGSRRMAAARAGAGAVTLLSPANALAVNAAHLTSIILRKAEFDRRCRRVHRRAKARRAGVRAGARHARQGRRASRSTSSPRRRLAARSCSMPMR